VKYVELVFLALLGSGGFYLLLDYFVDYLRSRRLVKSLKLETIIEWAAAFAVRAAENYGRARGLSGTEKFSRAVEMARERLLTCGVEPEDARLKQSVGATYEKLRPTLKRPEE
jgi:hypothetical protein